MSHNGTFRRYECTTLKTIESGTLGIEGIAHLFDISLEDFENLGTYYESGDSPYTIVIETNVGTKTITVVSGSGSAPSVIEDLIEKIEDQEEELFVTPTPGASTVPTSTPTPTSTPSPTPTPTSQSTATPTPTPFGETVEEFSCSMLPVYGRAIIVSNIVCLPGQ